jgi:hypothetical protein
MENHHHSFRHFCHSYAWHHLVICVYIKPLENISKIESLRQDGIQLDIRSCTVGEESKLCACDERTVQLWKIMIYV